jgi:hypothetical protein
MRVPNLIVSSTDFFSPKNSCIDGIYTYGELNVIKLGSFYYK